MLDKGTTIPFLPGGNGRREHRLLPLRLLNLNGPVRAGRKRAPPPHLHHPTCYARQAGRAYTTAIRKPPPAHTFHTPHCQPHLPSLNTLLIFCMGWDLQGGCPLALAPTTALRHTCTATPAGRNTAAASAWRPGEPGGLPFFARRLKPGDAALSHTSMLLRVPQALYLQKARAPHLPH